MKHKTLCAATLAVSFLSGCATWSERGVDVRPPRKVVVAILPARFAVRIRYLKEIEDVPKGQNLSAVQEKEAVRQKAQELAGFVADSFAARLKDSYFFTPADSAAVSGAMSALSLSTTDASVDLSTAEIQSLGQALKADAFLRVTVLGYGRIQRRWIFLLLGSGMVEGAAQGITVAEASGSVPAALAVGGEEVLQETAEDVGGVLFYSKFFTPVILKAELLSAKTGLVIWRWWALGERDRKALKKLPEAERAQKSARLKIVFEAARDRLIRKLEKAALKNELAPESAP